MQFPNPFDQGGDKKEGGGFEMPKMPEFEAPAFAAPFLPKKESGPPPPPPPTRPPPPPLPEVDETWTTTASGLQYKDEVVGSGPVPEKGAVVEVRYTGWLQASGEEFDSTGDRSPFAFQVRTPP